MYLFIGSDGQELHKSINHQLAQQKLMAQSVSSTDINGVDTGDTKIKGKHFTFV